ncbi:MAG: tetratricopeptide repeat protein [Labilithrix sp.]|nr:tetratricopeptide repeat protein [Labilithrix sp.]MCW5814675.1 tetratricopeptide repeat protein [Labilithrix sp.]
MRKTALAVLLIGVAACARPTPIERAQQLVRLHREPEATALLRGHLGAHPDDVPARRLLVRVLAFAGDLEGAKREAEEIARRRPDDPTAWIEMGHAYELAHRFDEALAAYDTAASTAPASPLGPREGGMRAARWGEAEVAAPRLEEAIRRGASDAETFHVLGLVRLNLREYDAAKAAYERGLAADPKSSENVLGLATVAVARGDAQEALAAYDTLARMKPRHAAAQLGRAWALAKLGRRADAERALDRAAELGAAPANVAKMRAGLRAGDL